VPAQNPAAEELGSTSEEQPVLGTVLSTSTTKKQGQNVPGCHLSMDYYEQPSTHQGVVESK